MENEACLVLIKPDALQKSITGDILIKIATANLKIIASKIVSVDDKLAGDHYSELKEDRPAIYEETAKYIKGHFHTNRVLAFVYYGENAMAKIRLIAGATNPEKAHPSTIRGKFGRVHSETGVWENCIHASDSIDNAEREIKLWFSPEEIVQDLYPSRESEESATKKIWEQ
jgi:nucleoside-diphosphate kinase